MLSDSILNNSPVYYVDFCPLYHQASPEWWFFFFFFLIYCDKVHNIKFTILSILSVQFGSIKHSQCCAATTIIHL